MEGRPVSMRLFPGTPESEETIAQNSKPSALEYENILKILELPRNVQGVSVLDIGAGASEFTARLLEQGADAYALDPKYKDMPALVREMEAQNRAFAQYLGLVKGALRYQSFRQFQASQASQPERYITGYASKLPFPDARFDLVCSVDAMTSYVDLDGILLARSIREALRVTKSGGTVQLFPYRASENVFDADTNRLRSQNQIEAIRSVEREGLCTVDTSRKRRLGDQLVILRRGNA